MDTIWTEDDIATLKEAILTCTLTVSYSGPPSRLKTYQSLDEMRALLKDIVSQVGIAAGTRRTYRLAATKKGFDPC